MKPSVLNNNCIRNDFRVLDHRVSTVYVEWLTGGGTICGYTHLSFLLTTGPLCSRPSLPNYDLTDLKNLSYPMGTVVTLRCVKGYQLAGGEVVKCEEDGTWFPRLSSCIPEQSTAAPTQPQIAANNSLHSKSLSGCPKHCSQWTPPPPPPSLSLHLHTIPFCKNQPVSPQLCHATIKLAATAFSEPTVNIRIVCCHGVHDAHLSGAGKCTTCNDTTLPPPYLPPSPSSLPLSPPSLPSLPLSPLSLLPPSLPSLSPLPPCFPTPLR